MELEENISQTIEAWRAITRPIWDILFGWLFDLLGWSFPWYIKDYLTVGIITFAMFYRMIIYSKNTLNENRHGLFQPSRWVMTKLLFTKQIRFTLFTIIFWPKVWQSQFNLIFTGNKNAPNLFTPEQARYNVMIFWETGVFLFFLIAINYVLVNAFSWPSVPPEIEIWV